MLPSTLAKDICATINGKFGASGLNQSERQLYLSLNAKKDVPLKSQLLRAFRPDELVLNSHIPLSKMKIPHKFYALCSTVPEKSQAPRQQEYTERFFTEGTFRLCDNNAGKWERQGELPMKCDKQGSEKEDEKKPQSYSKSNFYLGNDVLYYIPKDRM